jgi:CheY-like chemotaxis protein
MDHMMPGMDGIETVQKIRALGYTLPIVALTAHEEGQAERVMANGFDAFIAKPVNVRQLKSVVLKFAPDEAPVQPEPGTEKKTWLEQYPQLAETFGRDAINAIEILTAIHTRGTYGDEDIRMYTINVHAMKTVLANMGEHALSAVAQTLEQAGRANDTAVITGETPVFLENLRTIIGKLMPLQKADAGGKSGSNAYLRGKLRIIIDACETYNRKAAKDALTELRQKKWPQTTTDLLAAMADHLLNGDYAELSKTAELTIN